MKIYLLMILVSICSLNGYAKSISTETLHNELDSIVTDICNKKIVLLGEDANHGSGKTMEVKIALIRRLIEECKFSAVFFESPVYEFLILNILLLKVHLQNTN